MRLLLKKGSSTFGRDTYQPKEPITETEDEESLVGDTEEEPPKPVKKAESEAVSLLKAIQDKVESDIVRKPNPYELEFLKSEMGYSDKQIQKGMAVITGSDRHRLNEWLLEKAQADLSNLF